MDLALVSRPTHARLVTQNSVQARAVFSEFATVNPWRTRSATPSSSAIGANTMMARLDADFIQTRLDAARAHAANSWSV